MKIICQNHNTKRKNTNGYNRYEIYKKAKTKREALLLGARPEDLIYDIKMGWIKEIKP